jgi:MATE family multidrug resistance protein
MLGPGGKKEVAVMAWPLAVGMISYTLMGLVDTLLIGRVGTQAQAGVGLGSTFVFVAIAFCKGLTTGAQSLVAAADGASDPARVKQAGATGILTGLISGTLVAVLLLALLQVGLSYLAPDGQVVEAAENYLGVRLWALPFTLFGLGCLAGLQGIGDTQARMRVSVVGNLLNAFLDVIFIFGWGPIPAMYEEGAALATVFSSGVMGILFAFRYRRKIGIPVWPSLEVLRSSIWVGLPAAFQGLLGVGSFTVMNIMLAQVGAVHLAASQIVLQIASVSFLPGFGIGEAGGILVGRYFGARKRRTAARALRSARWMAVMVMGSCGLLFAVCGDLIASWFSQDSEVVALSGRLLLFAAAFQIMDAVVMVHLCALRGVGDTRFTLLVTSLASWGLTIPLTALFGLYLGWGATGAWFGLTIEISVLAAITWWRVARIRQGRVGQLRVLLGGA